MTWDPTSLPWLPPPPADLRARARGVQGDERGRALLHLASHRLDLNGVRHVARAVRRALDDDAFAPLRRVGLALLSGATVDLMTDSIVAGAARHGVAVALHSVPFGQVQQELLDPDSSLRRSPANVVLLLLDHRALPAQDDPSAPHGAVDEVLAQVDQARAALAGRTLVLSTIPQPPVRLFGGLDATLPGSRTAGVAAVNAGVVERAAAWGAPLLDLASLAAEAGTARWHDAAHYHLHKLPFSPSLGPWVGDHVGRLLGALQGTSRKCLVLDLDNTCWGGVIGDDGLEGIEIGPGTGVGEAHAALQRYALELRRRGVVLAVCSKNDDATARLPFREHPDMLLREEHIAVFQANWRDKASNLAAIARVLDIGRDALVFVDDNPVERAIVREHLPEVAVPELPDDPSGYVAAVAGGGWFEAVAWSAQDGARAGQYQANAQRAALEEQVADLDAFHRSLEMVIGFAPFDAVGRPRIAQLIGRSNQFNLTTRRYTAEQIAALEDDPAVVTMQVRLADRFGDNGMIAVLIGRLAGGTLEIDTWLMSCRVLGRRAEEATLAELARRARALGVSELLGRWIPSGRNGLVEEHYRKLGFRPAGTDDDHTLWRLELADWTASELPFEVVTGGG